MTAWRVTYLPESTSEARRALTVTVVDPESSSLETFVSRLSGGALGAEWTQGRVIRSIEANEFYARRRRNPAILASVTVVVAVVSVIAGFALVGVVSHGPPARHAWYGTLYTGAACAEGCFSQPLTEVFPNGSEISGTWTAAQPAVIFIQTTNGTICPGGTQSGSSCTEPGVISGSFEFRYAEGTLNFVAGSQDPENVSVTGYWST
jgi:hypothetical protein